MSKIYFSRRCVKLFVALLLVGCFFIPGKAFAKKISGDKLITDPQQAIRGTVKDASNGKPLSGATISVKGSITNTVSNADGAFTITVPDNNSVLVISYVGYASQEVTVGTNATLEISLQPTSSDLGEVVVVGYGTQTKKDVTGSVKSLKSNEFNKGIINSPQQLLQGKVAGVNVTSATGEPGSALSITIRGPGSVRSGSTPLFVVDGLPLDNASTGGGDPLNFINPEDIESFDVLKDTPVLDRKSVV